MLDCGPKFFWELEIADQVGDYNGVNLHFIMSVVVIRRMRILTKVKIVVFWNMFPGRSRPHWVRSKLVGASCFFYLLPSLCYLTLAKEVDCPFRIALTLALFLGFSMVCITAFMSEFIHIPELSMNEKSDWLRNPRRYSPSKWGNIDRVLSSTMSSLAAIEGMVRVGLAEAALSLLLCFAFILFSRSAPSTEAWVIRHTLWHFASSLIPSIFTFM